MMRCSKSGFAQFAILATLVFPVLAQAVPITFQVRMSQQVLLGKFDPGQDSVDLAGSFNGWGSDPLTPLSDADGDTIYEITLGDFTPGEQIQYKYRINGQWDGTEEFPGVGYNRFYDVEESGNVITVWYNDQEPGDGEVVIGDLHWWNDAVFYEIFVRSFSDSDGDGIGDLVGLTQKLDYLNDGDPATDDDLGITGIWLMPINDAPSYHGYDSTDYQSINPDYGTMADFEAFLAAAHARGIKVIVDYVMNHCSNQHPWFAAAEEGDLTYRDYFRWSLFDPNQTGPWGQDVWHWHDTGWYYGLFYGGMPDLNYNTPEVKTSMFETAAFWLDTVGVDGFRLDAVLYIHETGDQLQDTQETLQFWQDYNLHVKSVDPDVLSVGEAWTGSSTVVQYVVDDRLDFCFEFELSYATLGAVIEGDAGYLGAKADQVYNLYPYLQFGTFLTNHDQDRVLNSVGFDEGRAKAAAGIYLTLPGIPFVYYGEEIGMTGSGPHENIRTPMQWTSGPQAGFTTGTPWFPVNDNYPEFNVADETSQSGSLLDWYRKLIKVRNGTPALRHGVHEPLASSVAPVMAFVRRDSQQTVMSLANTSDVAQDTFILTGSAASLMPGENNLVNLLDPSDAPVVTVTPEYEIIGLDLEGYEVKIYEFKGLSAVDSGNLPKTGLLLEQNHPNPFNPSTTIRYSLPARSHVRVGIYDVAGREIALLKNEVQEKGAQEVRWDGADRAGQPMGAGAYFVKLDAAGNTRLSKMMLVK